MFILCFIYLLICCVQNTNITDLMERIQKFDDKMSARAHRYLHLLEIPKMLSNTICNKKQWYHTYDDYLYYIKELNQYFMETSCSCYLYDKTQKFRDEQKEMEEYTLIIIFLIENWYIEMRETKFDCVVTKKPTISDL